MMSYRAFYRVFAAGLCACVLWAAPVWAQLSDQSGEDEPWRGAVDVLVLESSDGMPYIIVDDRHFILTPETEVFQGANRVPRNRLAPGMVVSVTEGPRYQGVTPVAQSVLIEKQEAAR